MHNRVEALRAAQGYTQQTLADRLAVSRQTVSSLENGRYNPSLGLAFKLAKLFHQPIEQIFWEDDEDEPTKLD